MRRTTTLLVGLALGAVGLYLVQRLRVELAGRDPRALADRVHDQLQELEARFGSVSA